MRWEGERWQSSGEENAVKQKVRVAEVVYPEMVSEQEGGVNAGVAQECGPEDSAPLSSDAAMLIK